MSVKGTQTEKNLLIAFSGESQARNRYTYFASQAKKDGFEQIAAIFLETADQEKEHAKRLFKFLEGGDLEITAAFPAGVIGTTEQNLAHAAKGEDYETTEMYPTFANVADKEGFKEIAGVFRKIAVAEARHRDRYLALLANVKEGKVFKRSKPQRWVCRNCGYVHEGLEAPGMCPSCAHPQAFFELEAVNY
ncbi:MAG TPA: rubrerythrin family protein [Anaerohalosphaeraceae bacterium]|jgi:rubrerythrin|nr:rubrerythrin family protein [Anaerohalosphaeraceae bacterium]HPB93518.1 rubrerythrin family protein [Anaerohalosphaeraceae bacterium]HRT24007.1 rubrerythrin family protein [Anaerohalosphaeraceae bacterium]HRU15558.1 rubrerythrin family protein [Anaerohalosphaeraceae bacterium]